MSILEEGVQFVSRRAPTLGCLISPSLFTSSHPNHNWLSTKGFHSCGQAKCTVCQFAKNAQNFTSTVYGTSSFSIRSYLNCNTKYVIYLVTCTSCRLQYIGWTPLKVCIRRHLSDINRLYVSNLSMVSRHFLQIQASFSFSGIERVLQPTRGGNHRKLLFKRESMWIFTMDTRPQHQAECSPIILIIHWFSRYTITSPDVLSYIISI